MTRFASSVTTTCKGKIAKDDDGVPILVQKYVLDVGHHEFHNALMRPSREGGLGEVWDAQGNI